MEIINLLIAFNLGLFSTLHCLGMCGGIIGALTLGMQYGPAEERGRKAGYVVAYNVGRITSYTIAGVVCGFVGQQVVAGIVPAWGHRLLQVAAAAVLVLIGLHLAGWLPRLKMIESFGIGVWRLIQPAGRFFMPVRSISRATAVGMIWGWLPCALVYSVLLWAVTSGNAASGAMIMFAFGLGTLPGMITAGMIGSRLFEIMRQNRIRVWAGMIVILFGIASLFIHIPQHDHQHQPQTAGHSHQH